MINCRASASQETAWLSFLRWLEGLKVELWLSACRAEMSDFQVNLCRADHYCVEECFCWQTMYEQPVFAQKYVCLKTRLDGKQGGVKRQNEAGQELHRRCRKSKATVALKPKSAIKWIKTGMGMENKIGPPWANNLSDDDWQAWSCQVPWDWALVSSSQFIQPFSPLSCAHLHLSRASCFSLRFQFINLMDLIWQLMTACYHLPIHPTSLPQCPWIPFMAKKAAV